ncbi:MAG: UDP-3-O-acyl-N-acetylglucosamine deacetylase [Candidatus Rokubacteria bacterium]|nr:UDP-3-O-acyl-N-acetylglucosamine deacetylase [Candidatus Rokubacteria bacterium]
MERQATIRRNVSIEGIGLHSGQPVQLTLHPAGADTGIIFKASDGTLIPANADHVVDSHFATTVGAFGVRVRTIEHLMAAAAALGIGNLIAEVDAEELPALDGSAAPFVDLLLEAGKVVLPVPCPPIAIAGRIRVGDESRWLEALPADDFRISYTLDNAHPMIGVQVASLAITEKSFIDDLAAARTYGFLKDVPLMRKQGLALGGSLDNAVVVGKRTVLNGSLRFADEFVRHKVLDLVGDLFLLGRPLRAHIVARNAGHALNSDLVAAIEHDLRRRRPAARPPLRVLAGTANGMAAH